MVQVRFLFAGPKQFSFCCWGVWGREFPAGLDSNLPAIQETWVHSLGQEDPLEKGMATYSSILAWRIPWTEEPHGLQFVGSQRVQQD